MQNLWKFLATVVIAPAALVAAASHAQTIVPNSDGPWTHRGAKVTFPRTLGDFTRVRIAEYSKDGRDASAGYRLRSGEGTLTLTIYVYPHIAGLSCDGIFEDARSNITRYKGSRLISEWPAPEPAAKGEGKAKVARYHLPQDTFREGVPAMYSDLYLYCPAGEKWLVKYRASWSGKAHQFPDIGALLQQIKWPAHLD